MNFPALALTLAMITSASAQPGSQIETALQIDDSTSIPFLQYLPKDFSPNDKDKKYPLILFLHGRGESNGPLSVVKKWGPPRLVDTGKDLPYIIISPQCPKESWWSNDDQQALLHQLLTHVRTQFPVDDSRIYLTGLSMGGFGSWELAARHPTTFAAVVPICGGGDPKKAPQLINTPIWAWHGDADTAVPIAKSIEMVDAVKKAGGQKITFTTLEGVAHNSWSTAYADPRLWQWLTQQTR